MLACGEIYIYINIIDHFRERCMIVSRGRSTPSRQTAYMTHNITKTTLLEI